MAILTRRAESPCSSCLGCDSCSLVSALPPDMREEARRNRTIGDLSRGSVLFQEGGHPNGIWIICSGRVKIFKQSPDGKSLITRTAQPGEMVGYRAFFNQEPFQATCEAMEKTQVSFFEGSFITSLIVTCGDFALKMLTRLARDLAAAESMATNMAYRSAHDRVLDVLYEFHRREMEDGLTDGLQFAIPRRELAELAGLTVETTVRVLRSLEKEGYLTTDGRRINFVDTKKLIESARPLQFAEI